MKFRKIKMNILIFLLVIKLGYLAYSFITYYEFVNSINNPQRIHNEINKYEILLDDIVKLKDIILDVKYFDLYIYNILVNNTKYTLKDNNNLKKIEILPSLKNMELNATKFMSNNVEIINIMNTDIIDKLINDNYLKLLKYLPRNNSINISTLSKIYKIYICIKETEKIININLRNNYLPTFINDNFDDIENTIRNRIEFLLERYINLQQFEI
jgi:hypothetical protein